MTMTESDSSQQLTSYRPALLFYFLVCASPYSLSHARRFCAVKVKAAARRPSRGRTFRNEGGRAAAEGGSVIVRSTATNPEKGKSRGRGTTVCLFQRILRPLHRKLWKALDDIFRLHPLRPCGKDFAYTQCHVPIGGNDLLAWGGRSTEHTACCSRSP